MQSLHMYDIFLVNMWGKTFTINNLGLFWETLSKDFGWEGHFPPASISPTASYVPVAGLRSRLGWQPLRFIISRSRVRHFFSFTKVSYPLVQWKFKKTLCVWNAYFYLKSEPFAAFFKNHTWILFSCIMLFLLSIMFFIYLVLNNALFFSYSCIQYYIRFRYITQWLDIV